KKLTNSKAVKEREVLRGVLHHEDGSLIVTDSHRLYILRDAYEGKTININPNSNKELKVSGSYPDVSRLLPNYVPNFECEFNVDEYFKAVDLITVAGKVHKEDPVMKYDGNKLTCRTGIPNIKHSLVEASIEVSEAIPDECTFVSNADYWIDALRVFKIFKYNKIKFEFYGAMNPFLLKSLDDK